MAAEVAYALAFDLQASLQYFDEDEVLISVDARSDEPEKVDLRKRYVRVYESDRAFVRRVLTAVHEHLDGLAERGRERERQLVVLFDIDQTLGSRKGKPGESATLLRPSAAPLMERLQALGVVQGIITTRGISDLESNLSDDNHLKRIAPYLEDSRLTAAEMERYQHSAATSDNDEVDEDTFLGFAHLLGPDLAEVDAFRAVRDEKGKPLPAKDLDKLLQLADTLADDEADGQVDAEFLVIDDRDYAGLLRTDRLTGVHLAESERAHF